VLGLNYARNCATYIASNLRDGEIHRCLPVDEKMERPVLATGRLTGRNYNDGESSINPTRVVLNGEMPNARRRDFRPDYFANYYAN
jgi:hypothetical protein